MSILHDQKRGDIDEKNDSNAIQMVLKFKFI